MNEAQLQVEVAYARPDEQRLVSLTLPVGSNCLDAVRASGLLALFPEIALERDGVGIFGKQIREPGSHELRDGDRVEIYRPLQIDPKQARLARARGNSGRKDQ